MPRRAVPTAGVALAHDGGVGSGRFPLGFGGQTGAGPTGERVGFVPADVRNRALGIERLHPVEREDAPVAVARLPIDRRTPPTTLHGVPAVGHPQLRALVAAVADELEPLALGDEARRDRIRLQQHVVTGTLVVEGELVAGVADAHDAARVLGPSRDRRGAVGDRRLERELAVRRAERVARQDVLDVGEQQLLVLLLVVEAERDKEGDLVGGASVEQALHSDVDVLPVVGDLGDARAGDDAALVPRLPVPDSVVVRVEQVAERIVVEAVAAVLRREDEGLEEPGRVRPVPLRRARVGHRLHGLVFGRQRRRQRSP